MGRRPAVALAIAAITTVVLASLPSHATASQEQDFVSRINAERSSRGLATLSVRSDLTAYARDWSATMASQDAIWHDPDIAQKVTGWTALGDNVGRGATVSSLHDAFMNSSTHRGIILDPDFNQVGVGVAVAGDTIYVTAVFVRRVASSTHTAPAPAPRPRVTVHRVVAPVVAADPGLAESIWSVDLTAQPVTVDVLMQLAALDE